MMSVLEYCQDVNKKIEDVLELCNTLGINVSSENDMLDDDAIVMLDNAIDSLEDDIDEEIIQKIEEDDYYDEVIDTLIDKKDNIYNSDELKSKKKKVKVKEKNNKDAKKAMYKNKEKLVSK